MGLNAQGARDQREDLTMKLRMTARHFDLTDHLKTHVEGRSNQLKKFFDNIIDLHWVLEVDKRRSIAEINAQVHGTVLTGRTETEDMYASVDDVTQKMEVQLKKYKARLKDRDQKAIAEGKGVQAFSSESDDDVEE